MACLSWQAHDGGRIITRAFCVMPNCKHHNLLLTNPNVRTDTHTNALHDTQSWGHNLTNFALTRAYCYDKNRRGCGQRRQLQSALTSKLRLEADHLKLDSGGDVYGQTDQNDLDAGHEDCCSRH